MPVEQYLVEFDRLMMEIEGQDVEGIFLFGIESIKSLTYRKFFHTLTA